MASIPDVLWDYFDNIPSEGIAVCKLCKQRMKNDRLWLLKKHLQKLHNAKCEVWNHFDNVPNEGVAVCKHCDQSVKNNRSYFLTNHLESDHDIKLFDIDLGPRKRGRCPRTKVVGAKKAKRPKSKNVSTVITITDDEDCSQTSSNDLRTNVDKVSEEESLTETNDETSFDYESQLEQYIVPVANNDLVETTEIAISQAVENPAIRNQLIFQPEMIAEEENREIVIAQGNLDYKVRKRNEDEHKAKRSNNQITIQMGRKTLMSAVWDLVLDDGLTPALLGSKHMQVILKPICQAISEIENRDFKIDEVETERTLSQVAHDMHNNFFNGLDSRLLSLRIDMDLEGPANCYCVSALFIDVVNIKTRNLGIIDLKDEPRLTEQHIKEVLHKYNIDSNQIISISWDNTKPKYNTLVKNSDYLEEIENFEKCPEIQFGDIKLRRYVGITAQLCLLDLIKSCAIFKDFLKCRNLTKFVSDETNGYHVFFEQHNLSIPELDSPWNYGSTYRMIHALNEARHILKDVKYPKVEDHEDRLDVDENLWLFIAAFCESVSFLQKTIVKYYSEEIHFGDFYAQWLKCKLLTSKKSDNPHFNNIYIDKIAAELIKSIEKRSNEFMNLDYFQACLYLDPRFHLTVSEQHKERALEYLKQLWQRLKVYNLDVINEATESQEQTEPSSQFDNDEDAFLNEFLCQDIQVPDAKDAQVYQKIEELNLPFKSVETNVLSFWDKKIESDSEMYALSAICFAIPATQNYCHKRFSHLNLKKKNANLSTFTKETLLSIRLNPDLLKDAFENIFN